MKKEFEIIGHKWCSQLKWENFDRKKITPLKKLNLEINYFDDNNLKLKPEKFIDIYTGPFNRMESGDWDNLNGT